MNKPMKKRIIHCLLWCGLLALTACKPSTRQPTKNNTMQVQDPHSFARPDEAVITHLNLDIRVDFDKQQISGTAVYRIQNPAGSDKIRFDTRDLTIEKVLTGSGGQEARFELGEEVPYLGRPLVVDIGPETETVEIRYHTNPGAAALQWLDPQQTAGKRHPFLFTQSQAILARTWIPIQDSPGIRFTYKAHVEVPPGLMAVMSASNPQETDPDGKYDFEMDQPIPSYLMALAVGNLAFRSEGPRTGVYAEPEVIDKAAWEFAEMEDMLSAAEELYGPYRWERYDLIVLPPSFPFGGMENPRLTFATPTVIAGDRSLTALVAHELAHSWSGNLVTNANWNDFWLNEGFTVYFERRITEKLHGTDYAEMLAELGYQDLKETIERLTKEGKEKDTHLKLDLAGRDPDDGMTDIAYEKGYNLLRHMEKVVGREKWDAFLRQYFDTYAFQSMTTEGFIDYVEEHLVKGNDSLREALNMKAWIYGPGLPEGFEPPHSVLFDRVEEAIRQWQEGTPLSELPVQGWSSHEWQHFLRNLPDSLTLSDMEDLDNAFHFTESGNSEILALWLGLSVRHWYEPAFAALDSFLVNVGRRKFLVPLYKELVKTDSGRAIALDIYERARPNYHSVSYNSIDEILGRKEE